MNRRELVRAVAEQTGVDARTVASVIESFTEVVTTSITSGDPVSLPGFAKFAMVARPERTARNPQTGETVHVPASAKPRITPLKGLKTAVAEAFEAQQKTAKKTRK